MRHNKLPVFVLGALCLAGAANATLVNPNLNGGPGNPSTVVPTATRPTGGPGVDLMGGPHTMRTPQDVFDVDIGGTASCDGPGGACNVSIDLDFAALLGVSPGSDVLFHGLGWDLTIETVGASWLSEATISFQNPGGTELFTLTPGVGDNFPGFMSYSSGGIVDLNTALGFTPLIDGGVLTLEFYEGFDDVSDAIDAFYRDPSFLTFDVERIAEPTIVALLGFGLLGLAIARRRRA